MVSQSNPFHALVPSCSVKMEECEDGFINFLSIDIHARSLDREGSPVFEHVHIWIGTAD